ncbi:MAG: RNA methyltransferase [Flavobacteriales bacterium]|jgi:tRNA G18 (ribose-2'-O)-methylase SpoU|nr:RNA methyltransferase [Flavobacteriales bacterium]
MSKKEERTQAFGENGYFGIGIVTPKNEYNIGSLWRTAYLMGASFIFTIKKRYKKQSSDTTKSWTKIPLFHFEDIHDLKKHLPYQCQLIGVEMADNAHWLQDFEHPKRAIYLLGAEDTGLPKYIAQECHELIKIPSVLDRSLNVANAGSVILYDRLVKTK